MNAHIKRLTGRMLTVCVVSLLVSVFIVSSVSAAPAADLATLAGEQEELDKELDGIMKDIRQVNKDKKQATEQLEEAQEEVDEQYDDMKDRIQYMYEEGDVSMLNTLFGSKNMADFVNKAYYVSTISDYDRKMLNQLKKSRQVVQDRKDALTSKEKKLKKLQSDRLKKQEELAEKIAASLAQMLAAQGAAIPASGSGAPAFDPGEAAKKIAEGAPVTIPTGNGTYTWDGTVLTRTGGVNMGPSGKETYYNMNMNGVISIMRAMGNKDKYWVRSDGTKMLGDYIIVAANLQTHPRGSIVNTSLGKGIVCDTGGFAKRNKNQIDIATNW